MNELRSLFKSIINSAFFKNTIILASGSTIAQAISFVFLIILQRWFYTPADFGLLGLYVSLSTLIVACSTLKFEYAILLPKKETNAITLIQLSGISTIVFSIVIIAIFPLFRGMIPSIPEEDFLLFGFLITVTIPISGLNEILTYWYNRKSKYSKVSVGRIIQNSSTETSRLLMGIATTNGMGLIIGRVFGQLVSMFFLGSDFFIKNSKQLFNIKISELKKSFKTYIHFPLFTVPTVFVSNFSNLILIALFFEYYGDASAGLVSISIQYIALPFGIMSSAFAQVFYKKITLIESKGELLSTYTKFAKTLGLISLAIVILVYLIPNSLIIGVIGPKWNGLTEFMKLSVLWQSIAFISSSLSFIYTRLMRQQTMILFALLQLILVYTTLRFGNVYFEDALQTFTVYVIGQCVYYFITIIAANHFIKRSPLLM